MEEEIETLDNLISVGQLLNSDKPKKYFIPAYQRGYRWSHDQMTKLIEDIIEYKENIRYSNNSNLNNFYCLQTLVIKSIKKGEYPDFEEKIENFVQEYEEVIDGQQRLTSLLILLQALETIKEEDLTKGKFKIQDLFEGRYIIQYETREKDSDNWLKEIKYINSDTEKIKVLESESIDSYNFSQAYQTAYKKLLNYKKIKGIDTLSELRKTILENVKFIFYKPDLTLKGNNQLFGNINSGKIPLNNAELVKALFLQHSNVDSSYDYELDKIAIQWDEVEQKLQNREFWGFVFSPNHPFHYDARIEYLLDLYYDRPYSNENEYYTFDKVMEGYRNKDDKLEFVKETWLKIREIYDTLEEWYSDRRIYHRIGYLLQYGTEENLDDYKNNGNINLKVFLTVKSLKTILAGKKKDEQLKELDTLISKTLIKIKAKDLFYGSKALTQILFLFNIISEDKRITETARFSFADYSNIKKEKGWDQEHIASHNDYEPKWNKRIDLVRDFIEYFTGEEINNEDILSLNLENFQFDDEKAKQKIEKLLETIKEDEDLDKLTTLFEDIYQYVIQETQKNKDLGFKDRVTINGLKKEVSEKDFIWNFVLLNAETNRSYGNSLYPVKRKRILKDESKIYTPIGTRNVFEKAYSKKLDDMLAWTKLDAETYLEKINEILKDYIKIENPFNKN